MPRTKKSEVTNAVEAAVETAEKAVEKAAKTVRKKTEKTEAVILQFAGNESNLSTLIEQAKQAYVEAGHRTSSIKDLKVYVKPEEGKAYYVINEDITGELVLF